MECANGHKFSGDGVELECGSCRAKDINLDDRLLFRIDVDEHYGICKHCKEVIKISGKLFSGTFGDDILCTVKFIDGNRP